MYTCIRGTSVALVVLDEELVAPGEQCVLCVRGLKSHAPKRQACGQARFSVPSLATCRLVNLPRPAGALPEQSHTRTWLQPLPE